VDVGTHRAFTEIGELEEEALRRGWGGKQQRQVQMNACNEIKETLAKHAHVGRK